MSNPLSKLGFPEQRLMFSDDNEVHTNVGVDEVYNDVDGLVLAMIRSFKCQLLHVRVWIKNITTGKEEGEREEREMAHIPQTPMAKEDDEHRWRKKVTDAGNGREPMEPLSLGFFTSFTGDKYIWEG